VINPEHPDFFGIRKVGRHLLGGLWAGRAHVKGSKSKLRKSQKQRKQALIGTVSGKPGTEVKLVRRGFRPAKLRRKEESEERSA